MADTPKIPTGRMKEPTHKEPLEPQANFQPRNAGDLEDSIDRAAARVAQDINARTRAADNPGLSQDTSWETRVERGEEWEEQEEDIYKREAPADQRDEKTASPPDRERAR